MKTNWKLFLYLFQWYINFINLLVNFLVPISILGILNLFICRALNRSQIQAKLLRRGTTTSEENLRKRDIRLVHSKVSHFNKNTFLLN